METIRQNIHSIFFFILVVITVVIWYSVFYFESHQSLLVTFFNVGQGDAIFIEVPNGNQILIDGGPGDRVLSELGRAIPFWDRSIDLLVLTHPHADHLDGLLEVLRRYDVGMILESGVGHSIPEYEEWKLFAKKKGVTPIIARRGQIVEAGRGVFLEVLTPFENFQDVSPKNVHDAAVVTRLVRGNNSILLMGDAEKSLEYRLLFSGPVLLDSDILKVGHHGSKTSTSEEFLRAVTPEIAVIQSGRKNRYGHPHQEVLERLAVSGATIFRNDTSRDIRFESDGVNIQFKK